MAQAYSASFAAHGGRIDVARQIWPDVAERWIDLSTGLNPVPWTPPEAMDYDPAPLPTAAGLAGLEAAAAGYFGIAADHVAAVPGSELALRLLPALGLPAPIVACRPSYGTHLAIADADTDSSEIVTTSGSILLGNPNNPDGRLRSLDALAALAERQRQAGGCLIVDEAFVDAVPHLSAVPLLAAGAPLVVTRSFGKFFGLAGVRLGFLIARPEIVARMRCLLGDWPVSAQAIAWGTAAYADRRWIAHARDDLHRRAAALDTMLARHGLIARGGCPLFRLVVHADAGAIFDRLARAGILTRPFANRADWLRFGLPADDAAFDRLDRALAGG